MINIIQLNGSSSNYDFEELKESIINSISPTCKHAQIYLFNAFPYSLSTDINIDFFQKKKELENFHHVYR